jgi:hypothetical protein
MDREITAAADEYAINQSQRRVVVNIFAKRYSVQLISERPTTVARRVATPLIRMRSFADPDFEIASRRQDSPGVSPEGRRNRTCPLNCPKNDDDDDDDGAANASLPMRFW